jgi:hypothetical protein
MNTSVHKSTGFTPFFLLFGREPYTVLDIAATVEPKPYPTLPQWLRNVFDVRKIAADADGAYRRVPPKDKEEADEASLFAVGDLVLVRFRNVKKGKSRKLASKQQGPYRIVSIRDKVTAVLQHTIRPSDTLERHFSHLVPYRGAEEVGDDEYVIDQIVEEKRTRFGVRYLVHFQGYSSQDNEWKSASELEETAPELLKAWKSRVNRPVAEPVQTPSILTKPTRVARLISSEPSKQGPVWTVALDDDDGPDDYVRVRQTCISNWREVFSKLHSGGGVGATERSKRAASRQAKRE